MSSYRLTVWAAAVAAALLLLVACDHVGANGGAAGALPDERIVVAGEERAYRLVLPAGLTAEQPAPLVFAWHGAGDSKDLIPRYSQLDDLARDNGVIVVYPNGRNRRWSLALGEANPDLAFFDALYNDLTTRYPIDRDRVYLIGMSNGASFSQVVAAQRADRIAAIASHSGGLGALAGAELPVANRYAVMVIHGADDRLVPVAQGRQTRDAYERWGHPVAYVEVAGLGHGWARGVGVNEQIWRFFMEHPQQ